MLPSKSHRIIPHFTITISLFHSFIFLFRSSSAGHFRYPLIEWIFNYQYFFFCARTLCFDWCVAKTGKNWVMGTFIFAQPHTTHENWKKAAKQTKPNQKKSRANATPLHSGYSVNSRKYDFVYVLRYCQKQKQSRHRGYSAAAAVRRQALPAIPALRGQNENEHIDMHQRRIETRGGGQREVGTAIYNRSERCGIVWLDGLAGSRNAQVYPVTRHKILYTSIQMAAEPNGSKPHIMRTPMQQRWRYYQSFHRSATHSNCTQRFMCSTPSMCGARAIEWSAAGRRSRCSYDLVYEQEWRAIQCT